MINKYKRTINKDYEKCSFWPTFTDLISTVLMVVIIILFSSESIARSVEKDVAESVNKSVQENLRNSGIPVYVDKEDGSITFGNSTLFDVDSDVLRSEAKAMLKKFIPQYIAAIYGDYSDYVSKIIIEGHTDDIGAYMYNLDLSQRRAYSVVEYIVGDEIGDYKYKDKLTKAIVAIGRSKAELIINEDNSINREASRRVEIKYEVDIKNKVAKF